MATSSRRTSMRQCRNYTFLTRFGAHRPFSSTSRKSTTSILRISFGLPERAHRFSLLDMLFIRRFGVLYIQGLSRRCGVPRSQLLRQWHSLVFVVPASMAVCCGSSSLSCVEQVDEWIPCCSSHDLGLSRTCLAQRAWTARKSTSSSLKWIASSSPSLTM